MDNDLKMKVDMFIETFGVMRKQYRWSAQDLSLRFAALVYALKGKTFDKSGFDGMIEYIKSNTKWYSSYRGHQLHMMAALLDTGFSDPRQAFDSLLECERELKSAGFRDSTYLPIAAYAMLISCDPENIAGRALRAKEIYDEMKKNHFWLTGTDDYPIAVLLAESDKRNDILTSEIESNFDCLHREGFSRSNGLQFLSHLLTFVQGSSSSKAVQTRRIYDQMKEAGLRVSSSYYSLLGYFSFLGVYREKAVEEAVETVAYLKSHKKFQWIYREINILAAAALVSNRYMENLNRGVGLLETGIGISIEIMIAAQTAALIAAVSAAAATSAAASAGS